MWPKCSFWLALRPAVLSVDICRIDLADGQCCFGRWFFKRFLVSFCAMCMHFGVAMSHFCIDWIIDFLSFTFVIVSKKNRIFTVRSSVVSCAIGDTWPAWFGIGIRYICWSHIGHRICRWKMANDCRHVQFISVARFVHDNFRHCVSDTRFSNLAIVHRNSRILPLLFMVSLRGIYIVYGIWSTYPLPMLTVCAFIV